MIAALLLLTSSATAREPDAKRGQKLAEQHCSRCHVVGNFNPTGGISSTPSFQLLVRRRPDFVERFETFYARRPHPAFVSVKGVGRPLEYLPTNAAPVELTLEDVKDIVAFAKALKASLPSSKKPYILSPRPKPRMR
ncbi:MAG: hypothetical protein Kow0032_00260 [Methyloligellaceae bacterium]